MMDSRESWTVMRRGKYTGKNSNSRNNMTREKKYRKSERKDDIILDPPKINKYKFIHEIFLKIIELKII